MVVSGETIVTEFYDGRGNGVWDSAEKRTDNASDCEIYFEDSDGGYCDNGNRNWDDEEIYADENQNGQWDEGEYFIDSADGLPLVDTYYYEVFTFSDSYSSYYLNDQLYLDDVERTNLRDEGGNPVLGAFGSMTSAINYFRIIDCTTHIDKSSCEDLEITKSVCVWRENVSVYPCTKDEKDKDPKDQCLPINFSINACSD